MESNQDKSIDGRVRFLKERIFALTNELSGRQDLITQLNELANVLINQIKMHQKELTELEREQVPLEETNEHNRPSVADSEPREPKESRKDRGHKRNHQHHR